MPNFLRRAANFIDKNIPLLFRIGLFFPHKHKRFQTYTPVIPSFHHQEYLEYIKDVYKEEENRKTVIETKSSQLLSQSGIVLSLIGVIIPLVSTNIKNLERNQIIVIISLFCLSILLYVNTIYHTALLTRVLGWSYMQPSQTNIEINHVNVNDFKEEIIKDYHQSYQYNFDTNNQKADFLNYAANSYTLGVLITAALIIITCIFLLFSKEKKENTQSHNPYTTYNIYNNTYQKVAPKDSSTIKKTQHKYTRRHKLTKTSKPINKIATPALNILDTIKTPCPCR